jgi:hypothetical protein
VRVNLVVVGDPSWQLMHYGFGVWSRTDADIVAFDRANEGFSHSVALWTFERRRPRFEPDVAGEAAGVAGDVVRLPLENGVDPPIAVGRQLSDDRTVYRNGPRSGSVGPTVRGLSHHAVPANVA